MPIKKYDKLVRDRIPDIIRANGGKPRVRVLESNEEFLKYVLAKVVEEAQELQRATTREEMETELADLREVISLVMELKDLSGVSISRERIRKGTSHGRFHARTLLIDVEEKARP